MVPFSSSMATRTDFINTCHAVCLNSTPSAAFTFVVAGHGISNNNRHLNRLHLHRFPVRIGCSTGDTGDPDPSGQAHPGYSLGVPAGWATPVPPEEPAQARRAFDPCAFTVSHDYRAISVATGADHISLPPGCSSWILATGMLVKKALWVFIPTLPDPFAGTLSNMQHRVCRTSRDVPDVS